MHKIVHIVPETRYGGIFRYIELQSHKIPSVESFVFVNQPKLSGLRHFPLRVSCLRIHYSPLILVDLLLNTIPYLYASINVDEIHCHTSFSVFHHLLFRLFGLNSRLYIHDYNIPRFLYFFLSLSRKLYVVSPALKTDFPLLFQDARIMPPYYSLNLPKSSFTNKYMPLKTPCKLIFLGNINKVKQISQYASQLHQYSLANSRNFCLDIYGSRISEDVVRSLQNLPSDYIHLMHPIPPQSVDKVLINYNFIVIPSKSEVFPLVYFESLKNGLIPLVNNLSFFHLCTSLRLHIFDLNDPVSFKTTHEWALSLTECSFITYHQQLYWEFVEFYTSLTVPNLNF